MSQLSEISQSLKSPRGISCFRIALMAMSLLALVLAPSSLCALQTGGAFQPGAPPSHGLPAPQSLQPPASYAQNSPVQNLQAQNLQAQNFQPSPVAANRSFEAQNFQQTPAVNQIQLPQRTNVAPANGMNNAIAMRAPADWQPPSAGAPPKREFPQSDFPDWPQTEQPAAPAPLPRDPIHVDKSVQPASLEIELPRTGTTLSATRVAANPDTQPFGSLPQNGIPKPDTLTSAASSLQTNQPQVIGAGFGTGPEFDANSESTPDWMAKTQETVAGWFGGESNWMSDLKAKFGGADIQKIFGSLAVVLGGYFGLVWLSRRFNSGKSGGLPAEVVDMVGQLPYGQGKTMQLVRLGSKLVLLINGPEGTNPIGEITDPNEVAHLTSLCDNSSSGRWSKRQSRRGSGQTPTGAASSAAAEAVGTFRNLMGRMQSAEPAAAANQNSGDVANANRPLNNGADLDRLVQSLSRAIRDKDNVFEA